MATQRVAIARGPVSIPAPVVAGDTVFVGARTHDILRLDLPGIEPTWRVPADGFAADYALGALLLLRGPSGYRGMHFSGERAWDLADGIGGVTGWGRYGDRLFSLNPGVFVADALTGRVTDHHEIAGGAIGGARLLGDTLLLSAGGGGGPTCAYSLSERRIAWERDLTSELRLLAGGGAPSDEPFYSFHGSPGRMVIRFASGLFGVSLSDGRVLWHAPLSFGGNPPVIVGQRIYGWTWGRESLHEQHLMCLDEASGEVIYKVPLAKYGGDLALYQDVVVGDPTQEHVAFGARSGLLCVFRLTDGSLVWSVKQKTQVYRPVIAGSRLLATTSDGHLLVF